MLRGKGLRPSPLVGSIILHVLAFAGIAWLGPVASAAHIPPKLVTVEIVTAEPAPTPTPVKPVTRALAAVKHALVPNRSPKAQPAPLAPEPTPPADRPESPGAPAAAAETPSPPPAAAGAETFAKGDVDLGREGSSGARASQSLAAVGPSSSPLGADGPGSLTSFARPKGGYQMKPAYPEAARRAGAEGISLLRFEIKEDGTVGRITVEKSAGHGDLDRAAIAAVQRWRFEPARRGAQAVAVWVTLPVRFELR